MYKEAKKVMSQQHYSSVSELIRAALRRFLSKQRITENGFTEEFEDLVLESAAEPMDNDTVLETEEDVDKYFSQLSQKLYGKDYTKRKVRANARGTAYGRP